VVGREQFCIGCGRTVDEIRVWNESDGFQRRDISIAAKARIAQLRQRRGQ